MAEEGEETDLDDGHAHFEHLLTCRVELSSLDEGFESSLRISALEVQFGQVDVAHLTSEEGNEGEGGERRSARARSFLLLPSPRRSLRESCASVVPYT